MCVAFGTRSGARFFIGRITRVHETGGVVTRATVQFRDRRPCTNRADTGGKYVVDAQLLMQVPAYDS